MILIISWAKILSAGSNYANRLGLDDSQWNLTRFTAQNGPEFDVVAPGDHHTLAIANGVAYCWGHNNRGKCGVPDTQKEVAAPNEVVGLTGIQVQQAAAGQDHSMFLSVDGDVFTFGKNGSGQLGAPGPSGEEIKHPSFGEKIVHIAASQSLSYAVGESGKVFVFGYCSYFRCGAELNGKMINEPVVLELGFSVSKVFLTVHGAYFSDLDGRTYVMGYNYFGELCYPDDSEAITSPVLLDSVNHISKVTSGTQHAVLLTEEQLVYGCGSHGHSVFGEYGLFAASPHLLSRTATDAAAVEAGTLIVQEGRLLRTGYSGYGEMNFQGQCYEFEEAGEASKVWCYADACFIKQ